MAKQLNWCQICEHWMHSPTVQTFNVSKPDRNSRLSQTWCDRLWDKFLENREESLQPSECDVCVGIASFTPLKAQTFNLFITSHKNILSFLLNNCLKGSENLIYFIATLFRFGIYPRYSSQWCERAIGQRWTAIRNGRADSHIGCAIDGPQLPNVYGLHFRR